jgi:hypothetical protein
MRLLAVPRVASLALAYAVLAACGDSTAPNRVVTVDTLLAEVNDVQAIGNTAFGLGGVATSPGLIPLGQECPFNSVSQSFVCPSHTTQGITINLFYQLFDGSGATQSAFSPTTTAAIHTVTDISGTVTPPGGLPGSAFTLTSHNDQTMSGLLTDTHTLNGSGNTLIGDESSTTTVATTITNLVLPNRGSAKHYPQSGTIATDITSTLEGLGSFTMNITMTFNGTSVVTMTFTSDGTTETCTFDLDNPSSGTCGLA